MSSSRDLGDLAKSRKRVAQRTEKIPVALDGEIRGASINMSLISWLLGEKMLVGRKCFRQIMKKSRSTGYIL